MDSRVLYYLCSSQTSLGEALYDTGSKWTKSASARSALSTTSNWINSSSPLSSIWTTGISTTTWPPSFGKASLSRGTMVVHTSSTWWPSSAFSPAPSIVGFSLHWLSSLTRPHTCGSVRPVSLPLYSLWRWSPLMGCLIVRCISQAWFQC